MEINEKVLEDIIRKVIQEQLGSPKDDFVKTKDAKSGIITVKTATVKPDRFDTGKAGDQVFLKDVVSLEESPRLMFGVLEMKEGASFDWTLGYDEVDYIIDGTLEIIADGVKSTASAGDIIFIPKNTSITFSTPDSTRFMYVTYPANWSEQ